MRSILLGFKAWLRITQKKKKKKKSEIIYCNTKCATSLSVIMGNIAFIKQVLILQQ